MYKRKGLQSATENLAEKQKKEEIDQLQGASSVNDLLSALELPKPTVEDKPPESAPTPTCVLFLPSFLYSR